MAILTMLISIKILIQNYNKIFQKKISKKPLKMIKIIFLYVFFISFNIIYNKQTTKYN